MNDIATDMRVNAPTPPTPLSALEIREYLDYALATLVARRDEILAALKAQLEAHPTIENDAQLGDAVENRRMAETMLRTLDTRRKAEKDPFLEGGRTVDAWFKAFVAPLDGTLEDVKTSMNDYGARKLAIQRAEAQRRADAAKIEADRAAAAAAAALAAAKPKRRLFEDDPTTTALDDAAAAAAAAERAQAHVHAKPAEHTRTVGTFGAVASMRRTWGWELDDITAVPAQYLQVNAGAIKEASRARDDSGKPTIVIPGIRWVPTDSMVVR